MNFQVASNNYRNGTETSHEILGRIDDLPRREMSRRISTGGGMIGRGGITTTTNTSTTSRQRLPSSNQTSCFSQDNRESPMMLSRHQYMSMYSSIYDSSRRVMSDDLIIGTTTKKEASEMHTEDCSPLLRRRRSKQEVRTIIENAMACLDDLDF